MTRYPLPRLSARRSLMRPVVLLLAALFLSAPGCGDRAANAPPATPGGAKSDKLRIALIMKSLANEFFSTMEAGAKRHQSQHSETYELIANGIKDETDLSRQVALVEEMIAEHVDAIVIAPADSSALVPVLKRAMGQGIVVVNIDNKLDDKVLADAGVRIPFVGPDNRAGARKAAEFLAQKLKPGDQVAILEGIPTSFNGQQRLLGFQDAMQAAQADIVDSQSGKWEMNIANQVASAMIPAHPQLRAILACNDNMALGASAAVKAAGKSGAIDIIGFDGIQAVRDAIRRGEILATVEQHADQLAIFGIEYALQILAGSAPPEDKETPVDLITAKEVS